MKKEIAEFLKTDDTKTLMMRGEHTAEEVIDAAIK